jgi:hypothetical protein
MRHQGGVRAWGRDYFGVGVWVAFGGLLAASGATALFAYGVREAVRSVPEAERFTRRASAVRALFGDCLAGAGGILGYQLISKGHTGARFGWGFIGGLLASGLLAHWLGERFPQ